jgi:DNA-binding XRE family transcriptional regulator
VCSSDLLNIPASELIGLLGFKSKATYYKKEKGILKFSLEEGQKIADFFNMDIKDVFFCN